MNDPATTEIYTYCHTHSLHDALPIYLPAAVQPADRGPQSGPRHRRGAGAPQAVGGGGAGDERGSRRRLVVSRGVVTAKDDAIVAGFRSIPPVQDRKSTRLNSSH